MTPVRSERHLLVAARDGDDRAFEELYARYRDRISGYIHGRVRDHGRAEDVAQEVFISALRRLRASDQAIDFKPWIYEIAKNACIDEYRRSQRNREVSLDAETELGGRALFSVAPTPPAVVESKQKLADLRGAMGGLSDSHHQLLVMREFEGLSYDEIGARTGMSRQMVESALFRARRKLGVEYDELASGRRCVNVQHAIDSGRIRAPRSLSIRERRQLARHLAHCQPCRVKAHLAGVDDSDLRTGQLGARIAALLPFPLWRWWPFGRSTRGAAARGAAHPAGAQSVQALAAAAEPSVSTAVSGAAVAAAALAIAAAGGGVAITSSSPGSPAHAAPARSVVLTPNSAGAPIAPARGSGIVTPSAVGLRAERLARLQSNRAQRSGRRSASRSQSGRETNAGTATGRLPATATPSGSAAAPGALPSAPAATRGAVHVIRTAISNRTASTTEHQVTHSLTDLASRTGLVGSGSTSAGSGNDPRGASGRRLGDTLSTLAHLIDR